MDSPFREGQLYSREDVYALLAVPLDKRGGNWDTGYTRYEGAFYVFCNIGTPGRTGHDYANRWDGDNLVWFAKTKTRPGQPEVEALVSDTVPVFVFWRDGDRKPFTFAGMASAKRVQGETPVQVVWAFDGRDIAIPEEIGHSAKYLEGSTTQIAVNKYERNRVARARCIDHYGPHCQVCGFDFQNMYGELGANFIHVHHLRELSEIGEEYEVDPITDLRPVCPNCHAMLHRTRPALALDVLKSRITAHGSRSPACRGPK